MRGLCALPSLLALPYTWPAAVTRAGPHLRVFFLADSFLEAAASLAACVTPHQAPLLVLDHFWLTP